VGSDIKPHLSVLLKLIVDGIPGRVWKGKEALLSALSAISNACKKEIESGDAEHSPTFLVDLVLKECKKNDKEYKRQAVLCLASLLKTFSSLNLYEQAKVALFEIASEELQKDDTDADPKDKPLVLLTK
jgi:proteasome component ECM29